MTNLLTPPDTYNLGKFAALGFLGLMGSLTAAEPQRPNVLVIITDQQQGAMMSCAGNPYLKTPNLDALAARGTRFERAYASNPVCVPSRFSMMTGTMPSVIGEEGNDSLGAAVSPAIRAASIGSVLRDAGYHTVYAGKAHLTGAGELRDNPAGYGFDERLAPRDKEGRDATVNACVQFFRQPQKQPFLLYASLINPHDICYQAILAYMRFGHFTTMPPGSNPNRFAKAELANAEQMPAGVPHDEFIAKYCPPLPANYGVPDEELSALWADKPNFMRYAREKWDDSQWRFHRWTYARLTERVDGEIGQILDALRESGLDKNTVIIFTSDHGEQDGAHRADEKSFLYEESTRVPFIVSWPGVTPAGTVDRSHLISSGLDLLPTICDFAGAPVPAPMLDPKQPAVRESLVDLKSDPGEMKNLASKPEFQSELLDGRRRLKEWYAEHGLTLDSSYIVATP